MGFVFYNDVAHGSTGFRTELAHEIGHFLGMGNAAKGQDALNYPATIMNQASADRCADPDVPTKDVQLSDAGLVLTCRQIEWNYQVKLGHRISYGSTYSGPPFESTSSPTPPGQVQTCFYTYTTTYFYVDGVLDSSEDDVSGFYCLYD